MSWIKTYECISTVLEFVKDRPLTKGYSPASPVGASVGEWTVALGTAVGDWAGLVAVRLSGLSLLFMAVTGR